MTASIPVRIDYFDGVRRGLGYRVFGTPDGWVVTDCGSPLDEMTFDLPGPALEQANAMQRRRWYEASRN